MTAPDERRPSDGGLVDWIVLPEGASARAGATDGGPSAPDGPRRPAVWRSVGAFALWGVAQTVPLLPRDWPVDLAAYRPLLPPLAGLAYTLAVAAGFVWWFVLRGGAFAEHRRETFRLRPATRAVLRRLPLVAVPLLAIVLASLIVVPRFIPIPAQRDNPLEAYLELPFAVLTVLALVSLVAPLLEEFLFRGWLQRRLERRLPAAQAIVLTAAIFAAVHGESFGFPIRLVFGLVAGYVAWSTGSIWPGVLLHAVYNGALVLGGAGTPEVDEATLTRWAHTPTIFWPALAALVAAALALVIALRALGRVTSPRRHD